MEPGVAQDRSWERGGGRGVEEFGSRGVVVKCAFKKINKLENKNEIVEKIITEEEN